MMPYGWTACTLLLWGQASDQLLLAAVVGLAIEGSRSLALRWELEARQFERVADASSIGFALISVYQFNAQGLFGIYAILGLLPWCLIPLCIVQVFSSLQHTPLRALVYALRQADGSRSVDLRLPLGLSCLLAASAGDLAWSVYAAACSGLLLWLLWSHRPAARRAWPWVAMALSAAAIALVMQIGFLKAQMALGELAQSWLRNLPVSPATAERASTAIGSIGRLKLSDSIYLRVRSHKTLPLPLLLTEASYSDFKFGTWSNPNPGFVVQDPLPDNRSWILRADRMPDSSAEISFTRDEELSIVPLPPGTVSLNGPRLLEVQRSPLGMLRVEAPSGLLRFTANTAAGANDTTAPRPAELEIPRAYEAVIGNIATRLELPGQTPRAAIGIIERYFAENFSYALVQPAGLSWRTPLASFLNVRHAGHCEYFASATVLLLRAAGIPARYAVGYSIDEFSPLEGAYLGRARDAHAWALAYVEGHWEVIDTTPARWSALESARASDWQDWRDLASWAINRFREFQAGDAPTVRRALFVLAGLLSLLLLWRLRGRMRRKVPDAAKLSSSTPAAQTALSELFARLARRGAHPLPGETTATFLRRQLPPQVAGINREQLITLYYAERFGPAPLSATQRDQLAAWIAAYLKAN